MTKKFPAPTGFQSLSSNQTGMVQRFQQQRVTTSWCVNRMPT